MNLSFKIDEVSKFSFRNEVPQTEKTKETYKPVFAVPVCDTTLTKTVKAALISFDDYFMEV